MNLLAMKQKRAELCDQQQAIVDLAMTEGRAMNEEESAKFEALQADIDALSATIEKAEKVQARADDMNKPDSNPYRAAMPGPVQKDKKDDAGFKNIGEFLFALREGDGKGRLNNLPRGQGEGGGVKVPEAFAAQIMPWRFKDEWSMGDGNEGGFAVPTRFLGGDPAMIKPEDSIVRPRATVIPAGDPPDGAVSMVAFGQGAAGVHGGVTVQWIGEGALKPETDGELREVTLQPHEVAAHTVVSDKLLRNWAAASSFIGNLLRGATLAAEDMAALTGNGAGKPFGVLNGPGTLAVNRATANQINYQDVVNMYSSFLPEAVGRAVWVASQSALPQIAQIQDAAGRYIFVQGDVTKGIPATLFGIPLLFTGKVPTLGNRGDLSLVDFTYYLLKDGSGPFVAASEHVFFRNNKTVIKVFWNIDGKGWVDQPLTLEDGVTQVSPYVTLDVPVI